MSELSTYIHAFYNVFARSYVSHMPSRWFTICRTPASGEVGKYRVVVTRKAVAEESDKEACYMCGL